MVFRVFSMIILSPPTPPAAAQQPVAAVKLPHRAATDTLPVMEHFYTLQGEGFHQGKAAYFIRLGGCDVGCVWCDVKASWNAADHPRLSVEDVVAAAAQQPARIAVVTGGEPLMYDLAPLTAALRQAGFKTHLETSAAYPVSGTWDWICVSPKKFKAPLPEVLALAHELKVVVYHESDWKWAQSFVPALNTSTALLLQPEWSRRERITPFLVDLVKQHPQWRISLQTHKYLDIP